MEPTDVDKAARGPDGRNRRTGTCRGPAVAIDASVPAQSSRQPAADRDVSTIRGSRRSKFHTATGSTTTAPSHDTHVYVGNSTQLATLTAVKQSK
ncbi:hypothetical protein E2562_002476 [Oryza meyeriana var. granulata]|uniref:Uncharacterized protein n=1 Tax=Oryza meyeriana var. granulata TaxID=110450 RepID=A0A6G1F2J3_9ORYZ|nr:hypothetical protein E2562_002476 [Oryza meyeriana var. granulata]